MRAVWGSSDPNPKFHVIDDQYNDELYHYIEIIDATGCTACWLEELTAAIRKFPGWGVGVNCIPLGYLLIFADRLMISGSFFRGCKSAADVLTALRRLPLKDDDANEVAL